MTTEYPFGWVATKTPPNFIGKGFLLAENLPEVDRTLVRRTERSLTDSKPKERAKPCKGEGAQATR